MRFASANQYVKWVRRGIIVAVQSVLKLTQHSPGRAPTWHPPRRPSLDTVFVTLLFFRALGTRGLSAIPAPKPFRLIRSG